MFGLRIADGSSWEPVVISMTTLLSIGKNRGILLLSCLQNVYESQCKV